MVKGIIFDCWNTLYFTNLKPHPFVEFAERIGLNFDYDYMKKFEKHFMLKRHDDLHIPIKDLLRDLSIDFDENLVKELEQILKKAFNVMEAYPETNQVLESLKKEYKLGIISNTESFGFNKIRKKFELDNKFDVILTSFETGILKPDKKMFEMMLDRLDLNKEDVIFVGDSLDDDINACEDFGIKGVLIDRERECKNYNNRIISLEEIKKFL